MVNSIKYQKRISCFCTICSKEKNLSSELLPAIHRYENERIKFVFKKSLDKKIPFFILSGKYGLLNPYTEIPYYDQRLLMEDIDNILKLVNSQVIEFGINEMTFWANDREKFGWEPYYQVIERTCKKNQIDLSVEIIEIG